VIFALLISQVAGILVAAHLGNLSAAIILLPVSAAAWAAIRISRPRHDFNRVAAMCGLVLAGYAVGALSVAMLDLGARRSVAEHTGGPAKMRGEVRWVYESTYGKQFVIGGIEIEGHGRMKGKVLIEAEYPDLDGLETAEPGYEVSGEVELGLIAGAMNRGGFDARSYWASKGVCAKALPMEPVTVIRGRAPLLTDAAWRLFESFRGFSSRSLSSHDQKAMMDAIVLSDKSSLDPLVKEAFSEGGIAHVMSASGLHVSMLIEALCFVMSRIGVGPGAQFAVLFCVLPVYAVAAGLRPSIIRALLMGMMGLTFKLAKVKDPGLLAKLGASGVIQLAISPASLFDRGFLLSYAAIAGIVVYSWLPQPQERDGRIGKMAGYLRRGLTASFVITAFTLPITSTFYGSMSALGPFANLIAIPAASGALAVGLGSFLVNLGWPGLGSLLMQLSRPMLSALLGTAGIVGKLDAFAFEVGYGPGFHTAAFYLVLVLSLTALSGRISLRKAAKCALGRPAISIAFAAIVSLLLVPSGNGMQVHIFSVGQGDAALVTSGEGFAMLVDTGPAYKGNSAVADKILPALRHMGITYIDVLMLTHGHADHASGLEELAMSIGIGTVVLPEGDLVAMEAASSAGLKPVACLAGDVIEAGRLRIDILNPDKPIVPGDDLNEKSMVALISYEGGKLLLQSDAGAGFEASYEGQRIYALKVGHHGSKTASGGDFLKRSDPSVAVVSVGKNLYGHPSHEAMERIASVCPAVFRTDISGMVRIVSAKEGMRTIPSDDLWAARPFFRALRP